MAASAGLSELPKNTLENFAKWGAALVRPPLVRTPPLPPSAFVAIILTPAVAIAVMFGVDTAASDWAHHLPRWFIDAFEEITNFGLGGWFLIPSAFVGRRARPVRHHHQAPDRPRAPLCRQPRRSVRLYAVHLAVGICQYAVRPFRECRGGRHRDRGAVAEDAAGHVAFCASHHVQPRRRARPSSERCHCRRSCRDRRRRPSPPLVRGPSPSVFCARA